jgi:hypothetical protein
MTAAPRPGVTIARSPPIIASDNLARILFRVRLDGYYLLELVMGRTFAKREPGS